MNVIIEVVKVEVPDAGARKRIYGPIFRAFRGDDWDTVSESIGLDDAFDAVAEDSCPWLFDEEDT